VTEKILKLVAGSGRRPMVSIVVSIDGNNATLEQTVAGESRCRPMKCCCYVVIDAAWENANKAFAHYRW